MICASLLVTAGLVLMAFAGCDGEPAGGPAADAGLSAWPDGWTGSGPAACVVLSRKATLPPMDMLIALDTSYSMDFKAKWTSVKAALETFAINPKVQEMGVGLQYFPARSQCNVAGYAAPAVGVAPLSLSGPLLITSLDKQRMAGGTPMVPVLQGALQYASARATANPLRKTIVLLATDGIPDSSCLSPAGGAKPNTLNNVKQVAAAAAQSKPPINTFVIGVGAELTALDAIAKAGQTKKAFLVDTKKDIRAAFLAALDDIRRSIACEWDLPNAPGTEQKLDLNDIQVIYSDGKGNEETFPRLTGSSSCAGEASDGWYFDDPKAPGKVILCGKSCKHAQSTDDGQLTLKFGCNPEIL